MTGGYKIDVRGSALGVLHRMEAHDAVLAASTRMRNVQLIDREGQVLSEMTGEDFGHRAGGDLEIVRGDLLRSSWNGPATSRSSTAT